MKKKIENLLTVIEKVGCVPEDFYNIGIKSGEITLQGHMKSGKIVKITKAVDSAMETTSQGYLEWKGDVEIVAPVMKKGDDLEEEIEETPGECIHTEICLT